MRVNLKNTRLPEIRRGDPFEIEVDGQPLAAHQGETIAAVLLANGLRDFHHLEDGSRRGLYCGIGRCFSCLVTVDGRSQVRACITPVRAGMRVETRVKEGG